VPPGVQPGVQSDSWPSVTGYVEEHRVPHQSLQPPQKDFSNHGLLPSGPSTKAFSNLITHTENSSPKYRCMDCPESFNKRYLLNKHVKQHYPPFECTTNSCTKSFQYKRDFDRHVSARHPETVLELNVYFCPYPACKFSVQGKGGSSRKDNMARHISTQHSIEIDEMETNYGVANDWYN
jgi:hypothetical protein